MKSRTFVFTIGFALAVIWSPVLEANPSPSMWIDEIGEGGLWFEFVTWGEQIELYGLEIDGQVVHWEECDIEDHGDYIVVYPWDSFCNAEGGMIRVLYYDWPLQEIAYGFAGRYPELPYNGSLVLLGGPLVG